MCVLRTDDHCALWTTAFTVVPGAAISVRSTAPNVALKGHGPIPLTREPRHACSNPYVRGATTSSSARGHFGDRCDAAAV